MEERWKQPRTKSLSPLVGLETLPHTVTSKPEVGPKKTELEEERRRSLIIDASRKSILVSVQLINSEKKKRLRMEDGVKEEEPETNFLSETLLLQSENLLGLFMPAGQQLLQLLLS